MTARFCPKVGFSVGSWLPCAALRMIPAIDCTSAATSGGAVLSAPLSALSSACACVLVGPLSPIALNALSTFRAASQNACPPCVCAPATPGAMPATAAAVVSATRIPSLRMRVSFRPCLVFPKSGGTLRSEPFRRQFAQNLVVRFAGGVALERVDEQETPRLLESGEPAAAPRVELGLVEVVAFGHLHERDDDLAEAIVGRADSHAVEHARVLPQRKLDFLRVHLLATRVDARRAPPEKSDRPVRVDLGVVAGEGVSPSVDDPERLRRLVGVAPVPDRYAAADGEQPDLVAPGRDLPTGAL